METTNAEARSVHGEGENKVAKLVVKADTRTAHTVEEITGCVREVAGILGCAGFAHRYGSNAAIGKRDSSNYDKHRRDCRCKHAHCSGKSALRHPSAIGTNPRGRSL